MSNLQGKKILIIDDDPELLWLLQAGLAKTGAETSTAANGQEGLRQFYAYAPDLVILDRTMPGLDGLQVCSRILEFTNIPIIMLTALDAEEDIVQGLESGAVDYVTKPYSFKILLARMQVALRHVTSATSIGKVSTYSDGYLTIDLNERKVQILGQTIKLTVTEYRLLSVLFQNANRLMTFQQILEKVWGWEYQDNSDYIHVYISHLRRKLEPDPKNPRYVLTEYGVGYQFVRQRSSTFSEAV
jgi:two-component system KDP operon response regulator KdpE